jgi:hypothetical protein
MTDLDRGRATMNEPDIEYRGHFIVVLSYESDGRQWRPKALVSIYHRGTLHRRIVVAPVEVRFDSEDAADTHSLAMAKKWIDDNARSPMP